MSGAFELRTMGSLLGQGRTLDAVSRLLLALAGAGLVGAAVLPQARLPAGAAALLAAGFLAGLVQVYFAVRVAFDAALVGALAGRSAEGGIPADPAALVDASLQVLGLAGPDAAGRDWSARWQGMRRLLRRQAACVLLQAATFLGAIALAFGPGT